MALLLDTGILLRLANPRDSQHYSVRQAVNVLIARQAELFTTTQNVAEFWNVATRLVEENGYGLSSDQAHAEISNIVEPICAILVEHDGVYDELKRLGQTYQIRGKQIHDARLVAMMKCWQIESVLTLNERDFQRYATENITVETPASISTA